LLVQIGVSIRQRRQLAVPLGDPWDGRSLEWSIPSPPPAWNFAVVPQVGGRDAFTEAKKNGLAYRSPAAYSDIEMPCNSMVAPLIGIFTFTLAFALVWHIWWLAVLSFIVVWGVVIARSFVSQTHEIIPASRVEAENEAFLAAARATPGVTRDLEMSPENRGKAAPDRLEQAGQKRPDDVLESAI